jgi:hypothetical protein
MRNSECGRRNQKQGSRFSVQRFRVFRMRKWECGINQFRILDFAAVKCASLHISDIFNRVKIADLKAKFLIIEYIEDNSLC